MRDVPLPAAAVTAISVVAAAAATLGFWLGASGDAVGSLLVAVAVLLVVLPSAACLAAPVLLLRPDRRATQLGLPLGGPAAWADLSLAETVTVRRPEDPLRPTVIGAFHELDALGLRTVVALDETSDVPGTVVIRTADAAPGSGPADVPLSDPWIAVDAVRLGRRVRRLVRQNVVVAILATILLVPLAALGRLGLLTTALAALVAALVVVVNSCRIHRFRSRRPPAHRPHAPHHRRQGRHRGRRHRRSAHQGENGALGTVQSAAAPSPLP